MSEERMSRNSWKHGNVSTTTIIDMGGAPLPATITLKSSAVGRLIELSTDGLEYFTPVVDVTSATMLVVVVTSSILNARLTGSATGVDLWSVR